LVSFTALTNTADAVTRVALPLLTLQLTRSPALVATVAVLLTLPWLVTALHVGVLVDRLNRRDLMAGAEAARMAAVLTLLTAYLMHGVSLPLIFVVALALGIAEVVAMTAGASIIPAAVRPERLEPANARITATEYLFNGFVGAPIGGFLVAAGFGIALGATGVVYVLGAVFLFLLRGNFAVQRVKERAPMHVEIRDGLRFLWQNRLLRTMALLIAVMAGCWSAWLAIIPAYAVGGPLALTEREYGFLLTALGAGGVAGTLAVQPINKLLGRRWSMFADIIGSFLLVGVPAMVPAARGSGIAIGAAAFAAGLGGTMWVVNSRIIVQSTVPNELLGRFSAASRLVGWGAGPVFAALAGILAQVAGFRVAFSVFAVLGLGLIYPFLKVITPQALSAAEAATFAAAHPGPTAQPEPAPSREPAASAKR
jgi:MFS family permease